MLRSATLEADWEIEIGGDAAVIDAAWPGFIDLRSSPEKASEVAEVRELASLADILRVLNAESSPVFTAKCDVWPVDGVDPYEFDATAETASKGFACYIDLLPREPQTWCDPAMAVNRCQNLCMALRGCSLTHCRLDLIIREAMYASGAIGVTAYLAGCGATTGEAKGRLDAALAAFAESMLMCESSHRDNPATIKTTGE
jgi:hypothetical protein